MHSCVFSVHSSIRPWSRSPQIYFLLGFSSDASIKLWEDDAADFRCRGGLRFMIGWSSENSRIWFISAKALQKWWQSQFSNPMGFIPSKPPCSTIYIFSTTISSWFLSGGRIKSKSNCMAIGFHFFLLRVWALAWRWHGTGRALLAILGRFGHIWFCHNILGTNIFL